MRIDFYYTNKRTNSLLRPDVDENQTVVTTFTDFHLKEQTSLNAPVFIIVAGNLPETNYCILSGTGATAERPDKYYYFVDHIEQYRKTVWHIHCTIDALATWKSYIKNQNAYALRTTNIFDQYINDELMEADGAFPQRNVLAIINEDFAGMNDGTYILSIAATGDSLSGTAIGGMTYYACNKDGLYYIVSTLMQKPIAEQLTQAFGSMSSAFGGLWWLPLKLANVAGSWVTSVNVCGQTISVGSGNVARINRTYYSNNKTFTCSLMHYGDFRDNPPYRGYYAKIPFVGVVDIDNSIICQRNRAGGGSVDIGIYELIDFIGGMFTCRITVDGYHVGTYNASCKVDMPLCSFSTNIAGMVGSAISKVGDVYQKQLTASNRESRMNTVFKEHTNLSASIKSLFTGASGGAVGDFLSGVDNTVGGSATIIGGYSGTTTISADPELRIYEKYQNTHVAPSSVADIAGRPCRKVISLNSVSGYCRTAGFHVSGKMTTEEKQQIEEAFNSCGVYDL